MTVLGQIDFQNKTFSLHNIVNNDNTISITNNLLSLSYKDSDNQLITYRKNISDLLTINAGDFVISSNTSPFFVFLRDHFCLTSEIYLF